MPKLSIVVPVYNAENYIHDCVLSILNQTFTDYELILVNDGSSDSSGFICDNYAQLDKRVKVIHLKNSGASVARNVGVENAVGDYIGFVDSDDYIAPNMYFDLLNVAGTTNADIIKCGYREFDFNSMGRIFNFDKEYECIKDSHNLLSRFFDSVLYVVVWNGIYKRELALKVKYPCGLVAEDNYASGMYLYWADSLCVINKVLYFYRQNLKGVSKSTAVNEKPLDAVVCFSRLHEDLRCLGLKDDYVLKKLRKWIVYYIYDFLKRGTHKLIMNKSFFCFIIQSLPIIRKLKMYYWRLCKKIIIK